MVVSHVHSTIERSAERIAMLYGGRSQWDGTVENTASQTTPMSFSSLGNLRGPMQPSDH